MRRPASAILVSPLSRSGLVALVGLWSGLWGALAISAAEPGAEAAVPADGGYDLSGALALVDWLAWAASDREVEAYLAHARTPAGPFAVALRPEAVGQLHTTAMPALYAVEATVGDLRVGGRSHVLVQVHEAVVYDNPAQVPLDGLAFRLFPNGQDHRKRGVEIQGVWVDNQQAEWALDGTVFSIELPEPLPPGERARILLHLVVDVPEFDPREPLEDGAFDPETTGAFGRADGTLNLGYLLPLVTPVDRRGRFDIRPIRANTEHAMFDPALFHVVLNAPSDLTVATTGVAVHRTDEGDQSTTVAVAGPSRDFAIALVPNAAVTEAEVNGTTIRVVAPAGDPLLGRHLLAYAEGAFRTCTDRFGPIAAAELDVVESPIRVLTGIEYPGLITVDVSHQGVPYHRSANHEWVVAHEVAHQWWGVEVGNDPALAPWLDEALASHAVTVYWEARYGPDAVDGRLGLDVYDRVARLRDAGAPDLPADLPAWKYDLDQYAAIVYGRGSLFFDHVRATLGDDRYFEALRAYHDAFTGRFVTADDLVGALAGADGDPETAAAVRALYARWITEAHSYEDLTASTR
ncbi:MAG: M1 family aminopeptidase [Myxococcota bacterium]